MKFDENGELIDTEFIRKKKELRCKKAIKPEELPVFDKTVLRDGQTQWTNILSQHKKWAAILAPHENRKKVMSQILFYASLSSGNREISISMLHKIIPYNSRMKNKSYLILWKIIVMKELLGHFRKTNKRYNDLRLLGILTDHMKYSSKLPREVILEHKRLLKLRKEALDFMKKIDFAIRHCDDIISCTSLLHKSSSGCPSCGVMYLGTSNNLVPFVKRVDRFTSLESLVKLEFEIDTLKVEKEDQSKIVEAAEIEFSRNWEPLKDIVARSIQNWWVFILAKRKRLKINHRCLLSRFNFRIRRLVCMKKVLDQAFKESHQVTIDWSYYALKFSDLYGEAEEYVTKKTKLKEQLVEKIGKIFVEKLRMKVAKRKQKLYREAQRREAHEAYVQAMILESRKRKVMRELRKRIDMWERRKFSCIRPECHGRRFFSKDRYEVHMRQHQVKDRERVLRLNIAVEKLNVRSILEGEMKNRLEDSRLWIDSFRPSIENPLASIVCPLILQPRDILSSSSKLQCLEHNNTNDNQHQHQPLQNHSLSRKESASSMNEDAQKEWENIEQLSLEDRMQKVDISYGNHSQLIYRQLYRPMLHLELLSKQSNVEVPLKFPLEQPLVRIGTWPQCELSVQCSGDIQEQNRIAKIHCMIYCQDGIIIDNSSSWGTYVVGSRGTLKVLSHFSKGVQLCAGDLLCVGVIKDGPSRLSALQANKACFVYRICSLTG